MERMNMSVTTFPQVYKFQLYGEINNKNLKNELLVKIALYRI